MSELSLLSGVKRTSQLGLLTSEFDPSVWTGCVSQERLCVKAEVADRLAGRCLDGNPQQGVLWIEQRNQPPSDVFFAGARSLRGFSRERVPGNPMRGLGCDNEILGCSRLLRGREPSA
jgi:hypothetical protein